MRTATFSLVPVFGWRRQHRESPFSFRCLEYFLPSAFTVSDSVRKLHIFARERSKPMDGRSRHYWKFRKHIQVPISTRGRRKKKKKKEEQRALKRHREELGTILESRLGARLTVEMAPLGRIF